MSKSILNEKKKLERKIKNKEQSYFEIYKKRLNEKNLRERNVVQNTPIFQKNFMINEEINSIIKQLDEKLDNNDNESC